jgi:hypothetical protein
MANYPPGFIPDPVGFIPDEATPRADVGTKNQAQPEHPTLDAIENAASYAGTAADWAGQGLTRGHWPQVNAAMQVAGSPIQSINNWIESGTSPLEAYRQKRDATEKQMWEGARRNTKTAFAANLGGEMTEMAAGAPAKLPLAMGRGAVEQIIAAHGEGRDPTVADAAVGAVGPVVGKAIGTAANEVGRWARFVNPFSNKSSHGALTEYLRGLAKAKGEPEELATQAGQMIEDSLQQAGGKKIDLNTMIETIDDLVARNSSAMKPRPIITYLDQLSARLKNKDSAQTLRETQNMLEELGSRIGDVKKPGIKRMLTNVKGGLESDLENASKDSVAAIDPGTAIARVGETQPGTTVVDMSRASAPEAKALLEARGAYAHASGAKRALAQIKGATDTARGDIANPALIKTANVRNNADAAKSFFPHDPEMQQAWMDGVRVAESLSAGAKEMPLPTGGLGMTNMGFMRTKLNELLTYGKLPWLMKDPANREAFKQLVHPDTWAAGAGGQVLGKLLAAMGDREALQPWMDHAGESTQAP